MIAIVGVVGVILGIVTETLYYNRRGSCGYYDSNHYAHFEDLTAFKGCSGPALDVAIEIVERQIRYPIFKERPAG